jgi:hypothetical protein
LLNVTSAIREWYGILLPPVRGIDVSKFINWNKKTRLSYQSCYVFCKLHFIWWHVNFDAKLYLLACAYTHTHTHTQIYFSVKTHESDNSDMLQEVMLLIWTWEVKF